MINGFKNGGIVAGATSMRHQVSLQLTNGNPATGLAWNTGGLLVTYTRIAGIPTPITLGTQTVTGVHVNGGFVEISAATAAGLYRLDLPNAMIAPGSPGVVLSITGTGLQPYHEFIPLEVEATTYGTAAAGTLTASAFTTSGLSFGASQPNRRLLQFLEGPAAGERVLVVGYSAGLIQVAPSLSIAPIAGNRFVLL